MTKHHRRPPRKAPVIVNCASCEWRTTTGSWRPARRALRLHVAKLHPGLAA